MQKMHQKVCAMTNASCSGDALLFAFFRKHAQALHLAWSCDGLTFSPLNADASSTYGDRPVLRSGVGRRSIRDPYLGRDRSGGFVLLATNGETASSDILVQRSADLVHWSSGHLLNVLPGAHRTWAPQFLWLKEKRAYLIYWSSSTRASRGAFSIYACWTDDFETVTPSFPLFEPGHSVIDAELHRDEATAQWMLFVKDERGDNYDPRTPLKAIRRTEAPPHSGVVEGFAQPSWARSSLGPNLTPPRTEGPAVVDFPNPTGHRWLLYYDCFMQGQYGVRASDDLRTWVVPVFGSNCSHPGDRLRFPRRARHGSFLRIRPSELAVLQAAYQ